MATKSSGTGRKAGGGRARPGQPSADVGGNLAQIRCALPRNQLLLGCTDRGGHGRGTGNQQGGAVSSRHTRSFFGVMLAVVFALSAVVVAPASAKLTKSQKVHIRHQLRKAGPPERTIRTTKETVETLKNVKPHSP